MPKFLDVHPLKGLDEKPQESCKVHQQIHVNLIYNQEEDRFYCILEAPNKQAVENHYNKHCMKCEWITEVKTTA